MKRRLSITISEDVYRGLHRKYARGEISHLIESLLRSLVPADHPLEAEYRAAAEDVAAEREAMDWIEPGAAPPA